MRRRALIALGGLAAIGALAAASVAAAPAVHHGPAPAAPVWTVDKAASRLNFRGVVSGQGFDGTFKKWDAQIAFDPRNLKGSHAVVTIDVPSIFTGDPTRDQMLPTAPWFSVGKFPKATFSTTAITQTGPGRYQALGVLRVKGASARVVLPFTLAINGDVARMEGSATLDRSAYGIGQGQFQGEDTVAHKVTVNVRILAKKAH